METNNNIKVGVQQGWQCPVCGRVNAPWMAQCTCTCNGKVPSHTITTGTNKTFEIGYARPPYMVESTRTPHQQQIWTTVSYRK